MEANTMKGVTAVMLGIFLRVMMVYSGNNDDSRLRCLIPASSYYIVFDCTSRKGQVLKIDPAKEVVWRSGDSFSVRDHLSRREYAEHIKRTLRKTVIAGPTLNISTYSPPSDIKIKFRIARPGGHYRWEIGLPIRPIHTSSNNPVHTSSNNPGRQYGFIELAFQKAASWIKPELKTQGIVQKLLLVSDWVGQDESLSAYTFAYYKYTATSESELGHRTANVALEVKSINGSGLAYSPALNKMAIDSWDHLETYYPHYLGNVDMKEVHFDWDLLTINIKVTSSNGELPHRQPNWNSKSRLRHPYVGIGFRRKNSKSPMRRNSKSPMRRSYHSRHA